MSENRKFRGVWVPAEIWLHKGLTLQEKMMLVEVDSLDNENGCFAGNSHFSTFLGLSERQVQRLIKSLKDKGYIAIRYTYKPKSKEIESRSIRVVQEKYPRFIPAPIAQEMEQIGGDKNVAGDGDKNVAGDGDKNVAGGGDKNVAGGGDKNVAEVVTDLSQGGDKNGADSNTVFSNTVFNNTSNKRAATKKAVSMPEFDKSFSPDLVNKITDWIKYKKEKKDSYTETGLKSLVTQIRHNVEQYGEPAVIDLINTCMAANYKGIIFDKLKAQTKGTPVWRTDEQQIPPQPSSNPFLDMLREEEARNGQNGNY